MRLKHAPRLQCAAAVTLCLVTVVASIGRLYPQNQQMVVVKIDDWSRKLKDWVHDDERRATHRRLQREYRRRERQYESYLLRPIPFVPHGTIEPSGGKVLILSACDKKRIGQNKRRFHQAQRNRQEYANYHGYKHEFVDTSGMVNRGEAPAWGKVPAVRQALQSHRDVQWVWWLDLDAIIMNEQLDLARHLLNPAALRERVTWGRPVRDKDYVFTRRLPNETDVDVDQLDILMTHDNMGWNAGSMFFRNTNSTLAVLDKWGANELRGRWWRQLEQTALTHLAFTDPGVFNKIGTVAQRLINAYYKEHWEYRRGDFVLHFAGVIKQSAGFDKYWNKAYNERIRVPKAYQLD